MTSPAPTGDDGPVYLTSNELAERLRVGESTVRQWRSVGDGPLGVNFGRRVLYPLPEVEKWEQRQLDTAKREQRRRSGIHPIN